MNYLRELNAFRDWVLLNRLSTGEVALWYSLMSINNVAGWIDWFSVPNQTLQLMTGLSRQGLDKARNQLVQKGLIEYQKGRSNRAGKYRMISFEYQKVGTQVVTGGAVEMDTSIDSVVGIAQAFGEAQQLRSGSALVKHKQNEFKQDRKLPSSSKVLALVSQAYESEIGTVTSMMAKELVALLDEYPADWILDAIKQAAVQNVRKFSYIRSTLTNWRTEGRGGKIHRANLMQIHAKPSNGSEMKYEKGGEEGGKHRSITQPDDEWARIEAKFFGG
jgi:DnaD/phage-associated family protein